MSDPHAPPASAPSPPRLPPPERCLHNLHRASDRRSGPPEATDLCSNDLGVFHMLDCPLFLGRPCAWFAEAPEPHPETTDAEIAVRRETLFRDFLTWRYRRRVRSLPLPRSAQRAPISVERSPEDDAADAAEPAVLLRAEFLAEATAQATDPAQADAAAEPPTSELPPLEGAGLPAAPSPELYPGQRRSEDRGNKKKRRRPEPRPLPQVSAESLPPEDEEDDLPPDDAGAEDEVAAPPPAPKTVEELFQVLPEAALPVGPPRQERRGDRGDRGGRGGPGRGRRGGRPGGDRGPPHRQGPPRDPQGPRDRGPGRPDGPPRAPFDGAPSNGSTPGGGPAGGRQRDPSRGPPRGRGHRRRRGHRGPPGPRGPAPPGSPGPGGPPAA